MNEKMKDDFKNDQRAQAEEFAKDNISRGEKLNLYDSFLAIHFDFKNKSLYENEIRKSLEDEFKWNPNEAIKIEFWFRLFLDVLIVESSGIELSFDQEKVQGLIRFIKSNINEFAISRIENSFSNNIKKIIVENKGHANAFFNFRVANISYGSLDLILEIANAKNLAEKFDNNIDLFIGFLEMYAPLALIKSLEFNRIDSNCLYAKVDVSKELSNEFFSQPLTYNNPNADNKLLRFLTLAKFSWVVPIVLSLILLLGLYKDMNESKSFYMNHYNSILQQQNELLKLQNEFFKSSLEFQNKYYRYKISPDSSRKDSH